MFLIQDGLQFLLKQLYLYYSFLKNGKFSLQIYVYMKSIQQSSFRT